MIQAGFRFIMLEKVRTESWLIHTENYTTNTVLFSYG